VLADAIEYDRYPLSHRVQTLRGIFAKFGPLAPPRPPARPPTLEERDRRRPPHPIKAGEVISGGGGSSQPIKSAAGKALLLYSFQLLADWFGLNVLNRSGIATASGSRGRFR
jgi:hypothetical protein